MKNFFSTILLLPALFFALAAACQSGSSFVQPVSVKYGLSNDLVGADLKKVIADGDDNVYVLSNRGLCRISGSELVKDTRYRPLANTNPVDVCSQEKTGYLYYLYNDHFLSNDEAGKPYGKFSAGAYNKIAVNAEGEVLLTGDQSAGIFRKGALVKITVPVESIMNLSVDNHEFYALTEKGVYRISGNQFTQIYSGQNLSAFALTGNEIILGTAEGYYAINKRTGEKTLGLQTKIPVQEIKWLTTIQGKPWAGTDQGAFVKDNSGRYRYYASKRWLNEDKVTSIVSDSKGNVYLLTPTGLNKIKFINQTYGKKADYFEQIIRQRHMRYGLVAEVFLRNPGDLATAEMIDTDNDGLWTSFYLGALALKYAVTKDPVSQLRAWETFGAYERLISINQLKGFSSRTFERTGFKVSDPKAWRPSPDTVWEWKGTTSSDEFVGYIFIAAIMDQFIAKTPEEKKRVGNYIDKIMTHIIDNKYNFVDLDGKPTLWGRWHPDYINWYAKTISDRKLGATHCIAGLQLAYALTKKEIYKKEAYRLMNKHGYLDNIMISAFNIKATPGYVYRGHDMGMGPWNHSDDEMEFLSFWPLYYYAFDDKLKQQYAQTINDYWQIELPEKHPAWNLITLGTGGKFDKESTLWYLREYPMDLIRWNVKNSHRKDLEFIEPGFRMQFTKEVLSPAERALERYNSNEFQLDGGEAGRTELTGAEYLFPYWLARYLNVLSE